MEMKLYQQLPGLVHEPLFQVFLYVQKLYNFLDRGRCMYILRGYGLGLKPQILLQRYWYEQSLVPKAGKLFGRLFKKEIEVTQGDLVSLKIFSIVVDKLVRAVLLEVYGTQYSHNQFF